MLTIKAVELVTCLGSRSGDFCSGQPVSSFFKALVNLQWQFCAVVGKLHVAMDNTHVCRDCAALDPAAVS